MSAVTARARAELRRRWRVWLALAAVVAVAGGAVIAAAAGARRTETSYTRFLAAQRASDVTVYSNPEFGEIDLDRVARLPQVATAGRIVAIGSTDADLNAFAPGDGRSGRVLDRPKLLAGRMPHPDRADEAAVSFTLARTRKLGVGDRLRLQIAPGTAPLTLRVVGVEASPGEFPPRTGTRRHTLHLSAAFLDTEAGKTSVVGEGVSVRLERGRADMDAFEDALREVAGEEAVFAAPAALQAANVQRSIHLQAVALWLVAGLLALVTILVVSQLLARQSFIESADHTTLTALGMNRWQLWAVGMAGAGVIGGAGALGAMGLAWVASPLTPLGNARVAEPDPGLSFDGLAMGAGVAATLVVVLVLAALPAWRYARATSSAAGSRVARPSPLARAVAAAALPPAATVGIRMAVEPGRGATAVPVRTSLAGVTVAIAALSGAVTLGASLSHLLHTPRLYGWTWDAYLESNEFEGPDIAPAVAGDPRVEALALADTGAPLAAGRLDIEGFAIARVKGSIEPVVVAGRVPRAPDEVAFGTKTLRSLGADIGDRVDVRLTALPAPAVSKRIVGRVVLPSLGDASRFGVGAYLSYEGLETLVPDDFQLPQPSVLVRFRPGVDAERALADFRRRVGTDYAILDAQRPGDVENFGQVEQLPLVLAALLAALAAATLAHTLVSAVRRRRRDLAILKTLGFVVPQVRSAVAWQATTLVSAALLIGLPLGIAAGRWGWRLFADQLGAVSEPVTPWAALLLIVPAAVLMANLIAAIPAYLAGRTRAAPVLRAE